MRRIKINKVIAVSSQDNTHPAESIINNEADSASVFPKWLSSPTDKTQHIEAEFLLDEAVVIRCIELGNWGSSSIEILAKNTSGRIHPTYITLLPSATLRTLEDSKSNANFDVRKKFTEEQFAKEAIGRKFNHVKIICGQPYTEPFQYGLSFLNFKADEDIQLRYSTEDFYSSQSIPSLFERVMGNNTPPKTYSSRGRQMVDVALSHTNNNASSSISSASEAPVANNIDEPYDFNLSVTLFLTDPSYSKKAKEISVNELIRLYEKKYQLVLIHTQKDEFRQIYSNLFSQANIFPESPKSFPFEGFSTPVNSSTPSMSSSSRKRGKHVPCNNTQLTNGDDQENLKDNYYDADFTPKKKARSCQKALFTSNNPSSGSQTVITLDGDEDIPSAIGGSYRPQDFIQSDGSVPSTSKAVSFVDCPICAQEFHVSDIEKHAATCENFKPPGLDSDDDDDESTSALYNQTVYCAYRSGTKC